MFRRKIILLSILLLSLLAVSAVSAAENATDDIVSVSDESEVISVEENQNSSLSQVAVNSDDCGDLKAPQAEVLKSSINVYKYHESGSLMINARNSWKG